MRLKHLWPDNAMSKTTMIAALLALAACSPGHADSAAQAQAAQGAPARLHPISNMPVVPLTVTGAKGVHVFQVEVARSFAEQEKGLMFRTFMGADEGMVFIRTPPDRAQFWMKNTVIPLDLIFVDADHRILNIAANAVPYDETPLPAAGVAAAVLELNGGRAAELGIAAGDEVKW